MTDIVWRAVAIGIGATVAMDLWAIVLNRVFGIGLPNWGLVGRWVWHIRKRKVFHDDIASATPYGHEAALGWAFHYLVGIAYAFALIGVAGKDWLDQPVFLPAFLVGMVTIGAGWFLLAPGMGAGWAASRAENPTKVRGLNILAHTVFAIGLYATALLIR